MKFDLHTHHQRCGHAVGDIRDYIEKAIELGLDVIGISDHSPFWAEFEDRPTPGMTMAKSEFRHYVSEVLALKEEYNRKIEVLLGVESDFFPQHRQVYKEIYDLYPFDYIIGSVHYTEETHIFHKPRWNGKTEEDLAKQKEDYYLLIQQSAQSGLFNILGHIDALKGYCPEISGIGTDIVDRTLRTIAEERVTIEVNTSGRRKACDAWFPSEEILERANYYGINVTFGSDSHSPETIASEREQVERRLKEIGFKKWVFYRQRKQIDVHF